MHYPAYAHFFTYSKGCKRPVEQIMQYSDILQKYETLQCLKNNTIIVRDDAAGFSVCYMHEHFKFAMIDTAKIESSLYSKCDESEDR